MTDRTAISLLVGMVIGQLVLTPLVLVGLDVWRHDDDRVYVVQLPSANAPAAAASRIDYWRPLTADEMCAVDWTCQRLKEQLQEPIVWPASCNTMTDRDCPIGLKCPPGEKPFSWRGTVWHCEPPGHGTQRSASKGSVK